MKLHKIDVETRVVAKARHIIGIGPVYTQSIEHFLKIVGDYDEAKKMAAQEYLSVHLRFNEKELAEIDITDTQVSAKGENILYIVVTDESNIRDIRARTAQCQNPDLQLQDFIPPQIFKRYIALSRFAHDIRSKNKNIKTQVRYGNKDVELWTKTRGEDERYERMEMEEVEREAQLPKFDHLVRWQKRPDRPPRRLISPTKSWPDVPSLRRDPLEIPTDTVNVTPVKHDNARKKAKISAQNKKDIIEDMEEVDEEL